MSKSNVYRDGKIHVQKRKCSTCIFRPGNLMNLTPGRRDSMEAEAVMEEGSIPCHQTLKTYGAAGDEAICRGFYDRQRRNIFALRLAEAMGVIEEVGTT